MQKLNLVLMVAIATICGPFIQISTCNMTPQFLYLQMMRDRLQRVASDFQDKEMASAPTLSTVTGLSSDGLFSISKGNTLSVAIPCNNFKSQVATLNKRQIYSAKLWLFPKPGDDNITTTTAHDTYTLAFTVSITADANGHSTSTKRTKVTWSKTDTCMELDLSRVVSRYSQVRDELADHDQECTISITVSSISPATNGVSSSNDGICSAFNGKTCSTPFLFFTHVKGIVHHLGKHFPRSHKTKKQDNDNDDDHSIAKRLATIEEPIPTNESARACGVNDLTVNLTKLPIEIRYPPTANIRVCRGICGQSSRTSLNFRLNVLSAPQYLIGADPSYPAAATAPCCAPKSFKPLLIVIEDDKEMAILAINEAIVSDCHCIV